MAVRQGFPAEDPRSSTTRLHRAEATLTGLGSAGWYAALEAVPNAVTVYDSQRRILYLNRAGRQHAGLTLEQTLGRRDVEIFPAFATREYLPLLERAFASRAPVSGECRVLVPGRDGEAARAAVFSVSYTPVLDDEGAIECVVAITSDITLTRRFEGQAVALRAIIDNAGLSLLSVSPSGVISSFNTRAQQLYGYAAQEVVGEPFARLFEPRAAREADALLERLRRGEAVEYEGYRRNKQGRRLELALTLAPVFDEQRALASIVETAQPLAERSEPRPRARERVAVAPARAVASIAHELNNALTVVENHTALVSEEPLPEAARQDLELARRAARRSAALVAELFEAPQTAVSTPPLDGSAAATSAPHGGAQATPEPAENGGRAVVLVIDDDPEIRASMRRLLAECDLVTLTAQSGLHALQILQERRVDAVVVDQLMPGMSGVQLLGMIRERWPNTARVLFTGNASPAVVLEAVNQAGAHKVLVKSMHALEIRNEIEASALVAARRAARR